MKKRIAYILTTAALTCAARPVTGRRFSSQKREIRTKEGNSNETRFYTKINL